MPTISMFYGIHLLMYFYKKKRGRNYLSNDRFRRIAGTCRFSEIKDTPLISERKAGLEIEKMILGTRPVEVNHRDPEKLLVCLGGKP